MGDIFFVMDKVFGVGRCYGGGCEVMGMLGRVSRGYVGSGRVGGVKISEYLGFAGVFCFMASGVIAIGGPFYKDYKVGNMEGADKVSLFFKLNRKIKKLCLISFGVSILCMVVGSYVRRCGY